jgi:hypothetical protein
MSEILPQIHADEYGSEPVFIRANLWQNPSSAWLETPRQRERSSCDYQTKSAVSPGSGSDNLVIPTNVGPKEELGFRLPQDSI